MLLVVAVASNRYLKSREIDEKEFPFEYYHEEECPEHFEDLFFPRYFSGKNEYTFEVPAFYKEMRLDYRFTWSEDYRGEVPQKYGNVSFWDQDENLIRYFDNRGESFTVEEGKSGIDLRGVNELTLKTEGSIKMIFYYHLDEGHMIGRPIDISFEGRGHGLGLWGMTTPTDMLRGYDQNDNYVLLRVESDVPIRAYVFGRPNYFVVADYFEEKDGHDEERTKVKELVAGRGYNEAIANEPFLVLSTFDDEVRQVNATLTIEIKDKGIHPILAAALALSIVLAPVVALMIWVRKKERL